MASYVQDVATWTTATGNKTATLTPAVGSLLVVVTGATGITTAGTVSDNQGGTYTTVITALRNASTAYVAFAIRNQLVTSAVSTIVTLTQSGDTGGGLDVIEVSGMSRAGAAAAKQTAKQDNQAAAGTPAPVFANPVSALNLLASAVMNGSNPGGVTGPSGWVRRQDLGYATPAEGLDVATLNSGGTLTTVTWGSTSATSFGDLAVELDTSGPPLPSFALLRIGPLTLGGPPIFGNQIFDYGVTASVPVQVQVDLAATITPALTRSTGKLTAIGLTLTVALVRSVGKLVAVGISLGVALVKQVLKAIAVGVTITVAVVTQKVKQVAIAVGVTITVGLTRITGKVVTVALSLAVALTKLAGKLVALSVSLGIAVSRLVGKVLAVALSVAVALTRRVGKLVAVAVSLTVALRRLAGKAIAVTATITPALTRSIGKLIGIGVVLAASIATQIVSVIKAAIKKIGVWAAGRSKKATSKPAIAMSGRFSAGIAKKATSKPAIAMSGRFSAGIALRGGWNT